MGLRCFAFLAPLPFVPRSKCASNREHGFIRLPRRTVVAELQKTDASAGVDGLPANQYVPLHVHSDYSLLDGASQLSSLVSRASELNVPALALTDHGVLYGALQLVRACADTNVKPIIGNEMYIVNDTPDGQPNGLAPKRYHLIVLARNEEGYRNLVKLTTLAHLEGVVGRGIFARPCINKAQLYRYREGLIVSSACLGGEIAQAILNDDVDSARTVAMWFRDVFGDDFYLEIQDHGSEEDKKVNPVMLQLSKELSIKVIATNDSHFTSCLDAEAHDALICIQTGKQLTDENRLRYSGTEYFKSIDEMRQCFVDHLPIHAVDEALYNTLQVANKVESYNLFGATRIPDFPIPKKFDDSHDGYLRHVSQLGLQERLKARIESGLIQKCSERTYIERLDLELDMIRRMGFSSYFLVVWDYIHFARTCNIPVGPGRGSAAGSLVAFALRITDVDPIPFNLLFERFLNIERRSMPDIDTDFSVEGRERVIEYVTERYGQGRVAQIITFNRLTSKAVLKDVARVHNVSYKEADRLAKLIPVSRGKPATLKELLSSKPPSRDFKKIVEGRPEYREWLDKAQRIEGTNKTFGIHAAGVVISADPLTDIVPLTKAKHGETITQYAMEDVESVGLLKMDFLGLKNLTVIEKALKFINQGRQEREIGEDLDFSVDALPLDDDKTYKLLAEGELDGIFQLDASAGMRNIVRELRPNSLEDISSILALYRPGPLDAGLIPKFIRRKHGLEPIEYDHPLLEPILKETYGIMVYQEQIMRIARDLAGYSLGQADILRRAMGKKKLKDMEKERPRFVKGAEERGIAKDISENLFDMMVKFAEYCFNKSHSTAYAYLTYQTAFLKANYPVEYCAALLTSNMQQSEKLVRYLADARMLGVRILPPSVNSSGLGFTVHRQNSASVVRLGFEAVKTVGSSVSQALIDERDANGSFRSIADLINRVDLRVLNKRALSSLIQAGAFDELHPNRKVLLEKFESLLKLRRKLRDKRKRRENKSTTPEDLEELNEQERLAWEEEEIDLARACSEQPDFIDLERLSGEKASIGFYASGHPLQDLRGVGQFLGCTRVDLLVGEGADTTYDLDGSDRLNSESSAITNDTEVVILSCVTELKKLTTAKGRKMARWMIEDETSRVSGVVFPGHYEVVEQVIGVSNAEAGLSNIENGPEQSPHIAEYESDEPDPQFVVQDDARVLVWGKVDRESSGTVQVIVDDVQRIEDTRAVVATARYNPKRSTAESLLILRKIAKDVLGKSYDGKEKNNVHSQRRRWMKPKALSKKNRVPLLIRYLDEQGNTAMSTNIGNEFRFPMNNNDLVSELQRRTGLECVEISVLDNIADINGSFMLNFDDVDNRNEMTGTGREIKVSLREAANDVEETANTVALEEYRSTQVLDRKPTELEVHGRNEMAGLNAQMGHSPHTSAPAPTNDSDLDGLSTAIEPPPQSVFNMNVYEHEDPNQSHTEASDLGWIASKRAEVINTMKWMPKRDTFSERVFCVGPRMNDFAPSDAFLRYSEEAKSSPLSTFCDEKPNLTDAQIRAQLEANLQSTSLDSPGTIRDPSVEYYADTQQQVGNNSFVDGRDAVVEQQGPHVSENESQSKSPGSDSGSDRLDVHGNTTSEDEYILSSTNMSVSLESCLLNDEDLDLKKGLFVDFDLHGSEGVLDAVCLFASDLARHYARCECVFAGMTGISVSKLVEKGVVLKVSGQLSFAEDRCMYVLVDVRENEPTGNRKRVRSFGPVLVMLLAETKQESMKLSTKKAKKLVDSSVKCLETAAGSKQYPIKREKQTKSNPSNRNANNPSTMLTLAANIEQNHKVCADGGQVLSSMHRVALLCVANTLEMVEDQLHVNSANTITISDPNVLFENIEHQSISAIIQHVSSEVANVKVKSVLSTAHGTTSEVTAVFLVACGERHMKFAKHNIAEGAPLYESQEVEKRFVVHSQRLSRELRECTQV
ncbi:unnamed protein product [Agarophyton chilense]